MRLWHYKLIEVLPQQMLVSQWREVIAIKRQWERDILRHRLVSYVKIYDKKFFFSYIHSPFANTTSFICQIYQIYQIYTLSTYAELFLPSYSFV